MNPLFRMSFFFFQIHKSEMYRNIWKCEHERLNCNKIKMNIPLNKLERFILVFKHLQLATLELTAHLIFSSKRLGSSLQNKYIGFCKHGNFYFLKNHHLKHSRWIHKVNKCFWLEAYNRCSQTIRKGQNILCKLDVFSTNYLQFLYKQVIRVFPSKANVINAKTS